MEAKDFWNNVEITRKSKKMTQKYLADLIGVPFRTFQGWLSKDIFPEVLYAYRISQALGVSVEYLVTGEKSDNAGPVKKIQSLARQILDETDKIK
jgi:transcriptional regulator with XRE-family HTH domain